MKSKILLGFVALFCFLVFIVGVSLLDSIETSETPSVLYAKIDELNHEIELQNIRLKELEKQCNMYFYHIWMEQGQPDYIVLRTPESDEL